MLLIFDKELIERKNHKRRFIGKIRKAYFSGDVIFGGQNPKNWQKNFKIFIELSKVFWELKVCIVAIGNIMFH